MGKKLHKDAFQCESTDILMSCTKNSVKFSIPTIDAEVEENDWDATCIIDIENFDKVLESFKNPDKEDHHYFSCGKNKTALSIYVGNPLSVIKILEVDFYTYDVRNVTVNTEKFCIVLMNFKNALRLHKVGE